MSVDAASAAPLRQVGGAAFRSWVRGVDLLLANADEAEVLAGAPGEIPPTRRGRWRPTSARRWWSSSAARERSGPTRTARWPRHRPPAVAVVDPTGAGDAFAAGLLAARLAGGDAAYCLAAASAAGARAVALVGARP